MNEKDKGFLGELKKFFDSSLGKLVATGFLALGALLAVDSLVGVSV